MFTAGPTSDTTTLVLRELRSRDTFTGTGLAYPKTPSPLSTSMAGRMMVPKGSMCLTGLSVSRPARLAVSSPKARATAPCDTSCRITEGMSAQKSRISRVLTLWVRTSTATSATPAMIQMVVRGLSACRRGEPGVGGGPQALAHGDGPDQCFAAQLMQ